MRVRIIDVEGTSEELASFAPLLDLMSSAWHSANGNAPDVPDGVNEGLSRLPRRVIELLENRGPAAPAREAVQAFLTAAFEWGDVDIRIGRSRRSEDGLATMLRLHRRGSPYGAFVYLGVRGANLKFRLPASIDLDGYEYAKAREVQEDDPYGLALRLTSPEALSEAIRLARAAYDASVDVQPTERRSARR